MTSRKQFRRLLPTSQFAQAALFGGWGLWQRNKLLSHDFLVGTGWETTARFHVWPWPFKFAVIENLPAFLAGVLVLLPIGAAKPDLSEAAQLAPSLIFAFVLWYRIGLRLDHRWDVREKAPWVWLAVFTTLSLAGALAPLGYTGYLPYAALVWLAATLAFRRCVKPLPRH